MEPGVNNQEYHELLDDLTERRFFGEVTLYFQGGNIESNRTTERRTKSEVKEIMAAKKRRRAAMPRPAGGA